jgi:hypothetical protein
LSGAAKYNQARPKTTELAAPSPQINIQVSKLRVDAFEHQ